MGRLGGIAEHLSAYLSGRTVRVTVKTAVAVVVVGGAYLYTVYYVLYYCGYEDDLGIVVSSLL